MGCSSSIENDVKVSSIKLAAASQRPTPPTEEQQNGIVEPPHFVSPARPANTEIVISASVIIQKWYRRYKARLDLRRRASWKIFQEIEYSDEQDQVTLYNFFNKMVSNVEKKEISNTNKSFVQLLTRSELSNGASETEREILDNIDAIEIEGSYKGPHVQFPITLKTIEELIICFKSRNILHSRYVKRILVEARRRFCKLPNVLHMNLSKQVTIVGDLHGKFLNLLTIFNKNGLPSPDNPYIFNGDFVDRGKRSLEVLLILCCFYMLYPDHVILNRGNHEDYIMNSRYGFTKEITNKYKSDDGGKIMELCSTLFSWLPLAAIIGKKIFVVHGGISDRTDLDKLMLVQRNKFSSVLKPSHVTIEDTDPPSVEVLQEWELILDLLWSDPQVQPGKIFNKYRGGGCCFGPDVTANVLKKHGWDLLIRSHECKFEGYEFMHDDKVLTVFSVSSYYADASNFGAYVKIDIDFKPRAIQFSIGKSSRSKRVGINEYSATRELQDKIYSNRELLMEEFKKKDKECKGKIALAEWTEIMDSSFQLQLPWYLLRSKLVVQDVQGYVLYETMFESHRIDSTIIQLGPLSETIYRNKQVLETVFRIIDRDCSGFVTQDEFQEACNVLNKFSNGAISSASVDHMVKMLDINKDGMIDFNEFLEAFRLVSLSVTSCTKGVSDAENNTTKEDHVHCESAVTTAGNKEHSTAVADVDGGADLQVTNTPPLL